MSDKNSSFPSAFREFSVLIKNTQYAQGILTFVLKVVQEGYVSVTRAIYNPNQQFRKSTTNGFIYSGLYDANTDTARQYVVPTKMSGTSSLI